MFYFNFFTMKYHKLKTQYNLNKVSLSTCTAFPKFFFFVTNFTLLPTTGQEFPILFLYAFFIQTIESPKYNQFFVLKA